MKSYTPSQLVAVYHPFVRTLHWLMALIIFVALGLGVWAAQLPRGDFRSSLLFYHKSLGVAVLILIVIRILARVALGTPPYTTPLDKLTEMAAGAGHLALYALMIAIPVSGYVMSTAGGHEVSFFGLFTLPSFLAENKPLAGAAAETHEALAWIIGIVIVVHLGATFWHARVKRDEVLTRMWPRFQP